MGRQGRSRTLPSLFPPASNPPASHLAAVPREGHALWSFTTRTTPHTHIPLQLGSRPPPPSTTSTSQHHVPAVFCRAATADRLLSAPVWTTQASQALSHKSKTKLVGEGRAVPKQILDTLTFYYFFFLELKHCSSITLVSVHSPLGLEFQHSTV